MLNYIALPIRWALLLLATAPALQAAAGDGNEAVPRAACAEARCQPGVGDTLRGNYQEFRAYSLYDLRRPSEGERDFRIDETLYRVDGDDLTIKRIIPLPDIVLH